MATLELTIEQDVSAPPARRGRRLGPLFWFAIGWMTLMFAVAIFANVLPLPSPTDMDMLERRGPVLIGHWVGGGGPRPGGTPPPLFRGGGPLGGGPPAPPFWVPPRGAPR